MRLFIFLFLILFGFFLSADVLLLKSADGSVIPGLALSWQEKDGGVLLNIDEKVDIVLLKKTVSELFPDMRVEVMGQNLFFSSVKLDTLLPLISGVDVDIQIEDSPFSVNKKYDSVNADYPDSAEKFSKAKVLSVDFDEKNGKFRLVLDIKTPCGSCSFNKIKGRKYAFILLKEKDGNYSYDENRKTADILLIQKGSFVDVSFLKKIDDGSYEIDELYMK